MYQTINVLFLCTVAISYLLLDYPQAGYFCLITVPIYIIMSNNLKAWHFSPRIR